MPWTEIEVCKIISAGHIFIHLPHDWTFAYLPKLNECMNRVYGSQETPKVPINNIMAGLVCAVEVQSNWHRVQVMALISFTQVKIKFLDSGGFAEVAVNDLRQIREDFLLLPFQALECHLHGVHSLRKRLTRTLQIFLKNKICFAQIVDFTVDKIPVIELHTKMRKRSRKKPTNVNRRLINHVNNRVSVLV